MISIILARMLCIYFIVIAFGFIKNKSYFWEAAQEMVTRSGVMLLTAIVTLILGLIMVTVHNIWVADWRVVITIICWLTLIKGVMRLLFPTTAQQWMAFFKHHLRAFDVMMGLMIVLGIFLGLYGFGILS